MFIPDEFAEYREIGYGQGFDYVESGPLVRSSYHSERHVFAGLGRNEWLKESESFGLKFEFEQSSNRRI